MKAKHYILIALIGLASFLIGIFVGKDLKEKPGDAVSETKVTTVDTIMYNSPIAQSELVLGTQRYTLPTYRFIGGGSGGEPRHQGDSVCVDSIVMPIMGAGEPLCIQDSAIVELPIIQRHYADSTYEAWVSGPVDPRMDSIRVFAPTTIITRKEWKPPKHWHIGVTAGYGYGSKGFQPYVGVGITYSIFSF